MQHEAVQEIFEQRPQGDAGDEGGQPFDLLGSVRVHGAGQDQRGDQKRVDDEIGIVGSLAEHHQA
jgi:hypothetical protein